MVIPTETSAQTPVLALAFETDEAPYVVKASEGLVDLEVPWRDGTTTQSAKRSELLRILMPSALAPDAELLALLSFEVVAEQ